MTSSVRDAIGKLKKKGKSALIIPIAYNFLNVPNGMVCTISFSHQNFACFPCKWYSPRSLVIFSGNRFAS